MIFEAAFTSVWFTTMEATRFVTLSGVSLAVAENSFGLKAKDVKISSLPRLTRSSTILGGLSPCSVNTCLSSRIAITVVVVVVVAVVVVAVVVEAGNSVASGAAAGLIERETEEAGPTGVPALDLPRMTLRVVSKRLLVHWLSLSK